MNLESVFITGWIQRTLRCFLVACVLAVVRPFSPVSIAAAEIQAALQIKRTWHFAETGVHFSNEFSGARLNECEQLSATEFLAVISPENTPINTSPWYAFKVWADGQRNISIRFTNTYTGPRGRPWLSSDGNTWKRVPEADYHRDDTLTNTAVVRLKIRKRPLWVASQEMIGLKELGEWTDQQSRLPFARSTVIGSSVEGRPIRQMVLTETTNANYVFVIGRQHPPEVTGSIALMSFVDTIGGNSRLANKFRRQFQTVVVPLVNPDGLEHGHWRSNLGAVDLNRDWKHFTQPETAAVSASLIGYATAPGACVFLFLDFHSTRTNTFYQQPSAKPVFPANFLDRWLAAVQLRCPEFYFERDDAHDVDLGTSKSWASSRFGAPAITCEFGYGTDRNVVRRAGQAEAEEMMRLLLSELENPSRPVAGAVGEGQ